MKSNRIIFYLILVFVAVLIGWIIKTSFSQPGMERFDGKYEELGFFRNENNTGPVIRLFAVRVLDTDTTWMRPYAESQPHTKYGRTMVFFFSAEVAQEVNLSPKEPYFPEELEPLLLARFEKTPMGESRFSLNTP